MYKVTYRERHFVDSYRCKDYVKERFARSYWVSGGLVYFRLDQFNIKSISIDDIISIESC